MFRWTRRTMAVSTGAVLVIAVVAVVAGYIARGDDGGDGDDQPRLPLEVSVRGTPVGNRPEDEAVDIAAQWIALPIRIPDAFEDHDLRLFRVRNEDTEEGRVAELLFDIWPPEPTQQMTTAVLVRRGSASPPDGWESIDLELDGVQAWWRDDQPQPNAAHQIRIWAVDDERQVTLIILGPHRPDIDGAAELMTAWLTE